MAQRKASLDSVGRILSSNDNVLINRIPDDLLKELLVEDQEAIKKCVGKRLIISGFDSNGNAEIEFIDEQGHQHTIWIASNCLTK